MIMELLFLPLILLLLLQTAIIIYHSLFHATHYDKHFACIMSFAFISNTPHFADEKIKIQRLVISKCLIQEHTGN